MNVRLTKKDCIVVFICAVFLLMTLGASGAASRERARRMVCKANLYQWFIAIQSYANDNNGKLLGPYGFTDSTTGMYTGIYPNECWLDSQQSPFINDWEHSGQVNHEALAPYLPGFNDKGLRVADFIGLPPNVQEWTQLRFKGAWSCPSNNSDTMLSTQARINARGYFRIQYSVYSRVELWSHFATNPDDFVANELKADKLLMADGIYNWMGILIYNHGVYGPSDDDSIKPPDANPGNPFGLTPYASDGLPSISGINKLFGDGHVKWKDRQDFDLTGLVYPFNGNEPRVMGGPQAGNFY